MLNPSTNKPWDINSSGEYKRIMDIAQSKSFRIMACDPMLSFVRQVGRKFGIKEDENIDEEKARRSLRQWRSACSTQDQSGGGFVMMIKKGDNQ